MRYYLWFMTIATAHAQFYQTIYSFQGQPDGGSPEAALSIGPDHALYGTTIGGGTANLGTVFQMKPNGAGGWTEAVLHSFTGNPDGAYPNAALSFDHNNLIYGTSRGGGNYAGTIFQLTRPVTEGGPWSETVVYQFDNSRTQNSTPWGSVLVGARGSLYTTALGEPLGGFLPLGDAVVVTPPTTPGGLWSGHILYSFLGASGTTPFSGLIYATGGLFGTTYYAGDDYCSVYGCGTVYELSPPATGPGKWLESTIHTFTGAPNDGAGSVSALTAGPNGVLYGTTLYGGTGQCVADGGVWAGCGVVFQLTPPATAGGAWTETVLHNFTGLNNDGAYAGGSVVVAPDGTLYGTTEYGGDTSEGTPCPSSYLNPAGCGTVFSLKPPATRDGVWQETILHTFSGMNGDGSVPVGGPVLSYSGNLFGATSGGGTAGKGTVYVLRP